MVRSFALLSKQLIAWFLQDNWGKHPGGGYSSEFFGRGVPPGSPNPDHFPYPFSGLCCIVIKLRIINRSQVLVKFSSNDIFWILLLLYYSFGVENTNTFIRSRGSLENHIRFKTIMVKIYTRFQTKTAHIRGDTYLYNLYRGVVNTARYISKFPKYHSSLRWTVLKYDSWVFISNIL